MQTIILASSSPYRKQLLSKILPSFDVIAPDIDESRLSNESVLQLIHRLSVNKALAAANIYNQPCLVIASDQAASYQNKIIGKPNNHRTALSQLKSFQGQSVSFLTGLCLYNSSTKKLQYTYDEVLVNFRSLNDMQIDNYLRREQPYDCAGSFKSEGLGICLFESIQSQDPSTLIGLPIIKLITLLKAEGIDPLLLDA